MQGDQPIPPIGERDDDPGKRRPALRFALAAAWSSPASARTRLRYWLEAHCWPADDMEALVFAVSVAVTNSVEHGYGVSASGSAPQCGPVEVTVYLKGSADGTRHAELAVRDFGVWRAPVPDPANRGYGLAVIRATAAAVEIQRLPDGTLIRITGRLVPAGPGRCA
ncbi:ATP-binding protein [Amycolatopsis tolypomycina]|uniref:ATP-binding protein n=1 Tax=Amycolatopsis tolypomycina TaxID=208445 RepID=UPI0033B1494B